MEGYKGLLHMIEESNIEPYKTLTEKDIKKFMKDLEFKDSYKPRDPKTGKFLKGKRIINQRPPIFTLYAGPEFIKQYEEALKEQITKLNKDGSDKTNN